LSVTSEVPWITVTSPLTVPPSTFTVTYTVAPNPTGMLRSGTIRFFRNTDVGGGFNVVQM
jgi:hypothetical protein